MSAKELQLRYLEQARTANQKRMRRYVETLRQVANADGNQPDNSSADRFNFTLKTYLTTPSIKNENGVNIKSTLPS